MRRAAPLLAILMLCAHAVADDRAEASARMRSAMADLAQQERLTLSLTGLQTVGEKETPFQTIASWSAVPEKLGVPVKLDLRTYTAGRLNQSVVADGAFLWVYNADRKEYVCVQYGSIDGPPANDASARLLRQLASRLRGTTAYVVRVLQDALAPSPAGQAWTPWLPLASLELAENRIETTIGDPPRQTMDFTLTPPDPDSGQTEYRLDSVRYWETGRQGTAPRTIEWTLKLTPGTFATGATFRFVPPLDARPVSEPGKTPD